MDDESYAITKSALNRASQKIRLAGMTKFGITAAYGVINWEDLDMIITDQPGTSNGPSCVIPIKYNGLVRPILFNCKKGTPFLNKGIPYTFPTG